MGLRSNQLLPIHDIAGDQRKLMVGACNENFIEAVQRPLRILHLIESLGEGGAEQNLLTLLRHLPHRDYEHHLAWIYADQHLLPAFAPLLASTLALGAKRGRHLPLALIRLVGHTRRLRPDVINAKLIHAQLAARFAARLAGEVPVVSTWECTSYTPQVYSELGPREFWVQKLHWLLDSCTGSLDAHIIAVSREVAQSNARALGVDRDRVSVIYNAFDPAKIAPVSAAARERLRTELGVRPAGHLLLSVGRMVPQKDPRTSVDAIARVVRCRPGVVLALAGQGPLCAPIEARAHELGIGEHIRVLGKRTDIPALLHAADLLVSSSRYEGHSVALMEALAAGLPAVLSRIESFVEVLNDSPAVRYFTPGDVGGLAATILQALDDMPALRAQATMQAKDIRDRFGPEVMAKQYDGVFRAAARQRSTPRILSSA